MEHVAALIGEAVALFSSTNLDDLLILLAFLSDRRASVRRIVIGQSIGIAAIYGSSVVGSGLSLMAAPRFIGLLGFVPILIGLKKLLAHREPAAAEDATRSDRSTAQRGDTGMLAMIGVTVANGGDNIGVYIPLFAVRSGFEVAIIGVVFACMIPVWVGCAYWLIQHRALGTLIRRYNHRLLPTILIALGCFILYSSGTLGFIKAKPKI